MMIRSFLRTLSLLFLVFLSDYCGVTASSNSTVDLFASNQRGKIKPHQTNFLFIIFDDLRVELSIFKKYGIISPNFERLAARSVTFENAYCQISVCNPSRDSLLTGLRPDTVGTYAFQSTYETYHKHLLLPTRLKRAGYMTAAYGKIRHWEDSSNEIWDKADFANWYGYQAEEVKNMNSSVMPDKIRNETTFPDHYFASMAIEQLQNMTKQDKYFMLAIGFKNPHLAMHVPFEYFEMYRSKVHLWNATDVERTFPRSAPYVSYRCCASPLYMYMNEEGAKFATKFFRTQDVNDTLSLTIHQELMWGYAAMITMVDKQLGRVLDAIDQLELWGNLTVVLTADHGMHNGEKGIWEKWTLFDESTHVPLLIAHPLSPFKGQRYTKPVELIDIFPTINDLLAAPYNRRQIYGPDPKTGYSRKFVQLQGKSLAPIILGKGFRYRHGKTNSKIIYNGDQMPSLNQSYAISQMWQCALNETATNDPRDQNPLKFKKFLPLWTPCDLIPRNRSEVSVMGYSMRTVDFRYTQYIPFIRPQRLPNFSAPIFTEELYDHRDDKPGDLGHKELINIATDVAYTSIMNNFRREMKAFLWNDVVYLNMTTSFASGGNTFHRKNTGGNAMSNK